MKDLLEDPHYWNPDRPVEPLDLKIPAYILTILCVTLVATLGIVMHVTVDNNRKWVKLEKQCLDLGGQWIRNDCVNNYINFGPPAGEQPSPGTGYDPGNITHD